MKFLILAIFLQQVFRFASSSEDATEVACTTLCPDGSDFMAPPDTIIPLGFFNNTCESISNELADNEYIVGSIECEIARFAAFVCQCPGVEVCGNTMCRNGGDPDPSKLDVTTFAFDLETQEHSTCAELQRASSLIPAGSTACDVVQSDEAAFSCGCPGFEDGCTICADGSDFSPDSFSGIVDVDLDEPFLSCGFLSAELTFLNASSPDCDASTIALIQPNCCSGVEPLCTFCPDGSDFQAPAEEKLVAFRGIDIPLTCPQASAILTSQTIGCESPLLAEAQFKCQCPGVEACTVCPDGSDPLAPDDTIVFPCPTCGGEPATCGEYKAFASQTSSDTSPGTQCRRIQSIAALACQCPGSEEGCATCPEGAPLANPNLIPELFTRTCTELEVIYDSTVASNTAACAETLFFQEECCTPNPPVLECDDDRVTTFYVEATDKYEPCIWLAARMEEFGSLCEEGHPSRARAICRETCGACSDECNDTDGTFMYDGTQRPCLWLSIRNWIIDEPGVCDAGSEAAMVCPETCGTCDVPIADGGTRRRASDVKPEAKVTGWKEAAINDLMDFVFKGEEIVEIYDSENL